MRTRWFRRRGGSDRDIDEELRSHIEMAVRDRVERGQDPVQARRAALLEFGNVRNVKEDARAVWTWTSVEQLFRDLRTGTRIVTRSPAVALTAVVLVALVIGGNTTIFSMVYGVLNKPAPGVHADRLVSLSWVDAKGFSEPGNSYPNYLELSRNHSVRQLIGSEFARFTMAHERGVYAVRGGLIAGSYFDTLRVPLIKGRGFTDAEAAHPGNGLAAIISERAWREHFQSANDVVGRPIKLNGHSAIVVGVAGPEFRGTALAELADVWVPLLAYSRLLGVDRISGSPTDFSVLMIGQLAPSRSLREAQTELTGIWSRILSTTPAMDQTLRIRVMPYSATAGGNSLVAEQGGRFLAFFQVITLLTLVIVCANVANLLVARAVVRQREMALRQSLGASRWRILRILVAEGLILSILAWMTALLFSWWLTRSAPSLIAAGTDGEAPIVDFTPDRAVAGYAMILAVFAMLAFTLAPALRSWKQDLLPWLKAGEQGTVQGRSRMTNVLVVVQLAFSVLLLTGAGLAYRSIFLLGTADIGYDAKRMLLVTVNTSGSVNEAQAHTILLGRIRQRLSAVPGVTAVSYARRPPREFWSTASLRTSPSDESFRAEINHVGPAFLAPYGFAAVGGREFADQESSQRVLSALISRRLADQMWPGQSAIGRSLSLSSGDELPSQQGTARLVQIVGVVPDAYYGGFRREARHHIFLSAAQLAPPSGETTFYIRHQTGLDVVAPAVVRALGEVDAATAVVIVRAFEDQLEAAIWPIRVLTILLSMFATGSLFIAGIGQYAVVSFDMRRRVREFGLRMALGASARQVLTAVVRESLWLTAIGLALGFAVSLAVARALAGVLYGVTPTDAVTFGGVFLLLATTSLVACYLPALRASRVSPMQALRHD